jgi:hypothetical protein
MFIHMTFSQERARMGKKVITIENRESHFQSTIDRVMRMVPDKDKSDQNLRRLLAFRLKVDGEAATSEYIIQKIREVIQCRYTGRFYDFIKNDQIEKECKADNGQAEPLRVI